MITIFFLTRDFVGNCSASDRNNLEWLRKQDRVNGSFNIAAPYPKMDYFRRTFIEPILNADKYIREECFDVPLATRDGINYVIKRWNRSVYKIKI